MTSARRGGRVAGTAATMTFGLGVVRRRGTVRRGVCQQRRRLGRLRSSAAAMTSGGAVRSARSDTAPL
jgi:hypothetical protein